MHCFHACIQLHFKFFRVEADLAHLIHRDLLKILGQLVEERLIRLQVREHGSAAPDRCSLLPSLAPEVMREVIAPPQRVIDALFERWIERNKFFNATLAVDQPVNMRPRVTPPPLGRSIV
ncbi:MAG: hypothetical protein P4M05_05070 [Bradyrhizobium sp.]|nr:hypothetical protein [Bradyrhizobium sp.]